MTAETQLHKNFGKIVKIEWLNGQIRFLSARLTLMIFFHSPVSDLHFLT